ncbi:MAG: metal-dependent hydrolase [Verrucomicrobia bacterium]|nr:MAG: metal-dependent hydrolase [Verrucomicrobiota bacterium]
MTAREYASPQPTLIGAIRSQDSSQTRFGKKHCWWQRRALTSAVLVRLTILGSGSNGNCAYLETDQTRLLIDVGLSGRQIRQRLLAIGRAPEGIDGILVTHEHFDHIQGLAMIGSKLAVPIYCNRLTKEAIELQTGLRFDFRIFSTGSTFEVGDVPVDAFSVPHDAYDPVGFLLHTAAGNIGFLTDLGYATKLVIERVRTANVLLLETNHDVKLLQEDTRRPWSVKQRILSRHGHLSNEAAAEVAERIVSAELHRLYLAHRSTDCNRPELAHHAVSQSLAKIGATHVHLDASPALP